MISKMRAKVGMSHTRETSTNVVPILVSSSVADTSISPSLKPRTGVNRSRPESVSPHGHGSPSGSIASGSPHASPSSSGHSGYGNTTEGREQYARHRLGVYPAQEQTQRKHPHTRPVRAHFHEHSQTVPDMNELAIAASSYRSSDDSSEHTEDELSLSASDSSEYGILPEKVSPSGVRSVVRRSTSTSSPPSMDGSGGSHSTTFTNRCASLSFSDDDEDPGLRRTPTASLPSSSQQLPLSPSSSRNTLHQMPICHHVMNRVHRLNSESSVVSSTSSEEEEDTNAIEETPTFEPAEPLSHMRRGEKPSQNSDWTDKTQLQHRFSTPMDYSSDESSQSLQSIPHHPSNNHHQEPPSPPRSLSLSQYHHPLPSNTSTPPTYQIYSKRWIMLFYVSILNLVSDWTCYSVAPIAVLTSRAYAAPVTPDALVCTFLGANALASALEPLILGRLGLRGTILLGSFLAALGGLIKSGWLINSSGEAVWRIYAGFFIVGLSQPLYQCTPALLSGSWFPEEERTLATGVALNSNQLGIGCAFVFGTWYVKGEEDIEGYFGILGVLSCVIFAGCCLQFESAPPTPPSESARVMRGTFSWPLTSQYLYNSLHTKIHHGLYAARNTPGVSEQDFDLSRVIWRAANNASGSPPVRYRRQTTQSGKAHGPPSLYKSQPLRSQSGSGGHLGPPPPSQMTLEEEMEMFIRGDPEWEMPSNASDENPVQRQRRKKRQQQSKHRQQQQQQQQNNPGRSNTQSHNRRPQLSSSNLIAIKPSQAKKSSFSSGVNDMRSHCYGQPSAQLPSTLQANHDNNHSFLQQEHTQGQAQQLKQILSNTSHINSGATSNTRITRHFSSLSDEGDWAQSTTPSMYDINNNNTQSSSLVGGEFIDVPSATTPLMEHEQFRYDSINSNNNGTYASNSLAAESPFSNLVMGQQDDLELYESSTQSKQHLEDANFRQGQYQQRTHSSQQSSSFSKTIHSTSDLDGYNTDESEVDHSHDHSRVQHLRSAAPPYSNRFDKGVEPITFQSQPHELHIRVRDDQLLLSVRACFARPGFLHSLVAFVVSAVVINTLSTYMDYLVRLETTAYPNSENGENEDVTRKYVGIVGGSFQVLVMLSSLIVGKQTDKTRAYFSVIIGLLVMGAFGLAECNVSLDADSGGNVRLALLLVALLVGPLQPVATEMGVEVAYPLSENTVLVIQQLFANLCSAVFIPFFAAFKDVGSESDGDFARPEYTFSFYMLIVLHAVSTVFFATFNGRYLRLEHEEWKKNQAYQRQQQHPRVLQRGEAGDGLGNVAELQYGAQPTVSHVGTHRNQKLYDALL